MASTTVVTSVTGECRASTSQINYATPGDLQQLGNYVNSAITSLQHNVEQRLRSLADHVNRRLERCETRVIALERQFNAFQQSIGARVQQLHDEFDRVRSILNWVAQETNSISTRA